MRDVVMGIFAAVMFIGLITWGILGLIQMECSQRGAALDMDTRVVFMECYIDHPTEGWIPYGAYRVVEP